MKAVKAKIPKNDASVELNLIWKPIKIHKIYNDTPISKFYPEPSFKKQWTFFPGPPCTCTYSIDFIPYFF